MTTPPPTVRRLHAGDADLPQIVAQVNAAGMEIDNPLSVDSLQQFLRDPRNVYLVAHVDGALAGALHAVLYVHPAGDPHLYIDEVDTAPSFRRRGVATALMREALQIGRRMGAREAWLGADEGNDAAHALYRALRPSQADAGVVYTYEL